MRGGDERFGHDDESLHAFSRDEVIHKVSSHARSGTEEAEELHIVALCDGMADGERMFD